VFSAEQSAEVAQKDQDDRTVGPKLAEAVTAAVSTDEFDLGQPIQIHPDKMPHRPGSTSGTEKYRHLHDRIMQAPQQSSAQHRLR
jgi:hypothetical protein